LKFPTIIWLALLLNPHQVHPEGVVVVFLHNKGVLPSDAKIIVPNRYVRLAAHKYLQGALYLGLEVETQLLPSVAVRQGNGDGSQKVALGIEKLPAHLFGVRWKEHLTRREKSPS